MSTLDQDEYRSSHVQDTLTDPLRQKALQAAKDHKTSWVELGQYLHAIWQDKLFYTWGFKQFETYLQKELGLNKSLSMKLLKSYIFIEEHEPSYLEKGFKENRDAYQIPGIDALNVLRLARGRKEILSDDYRKIKTDIFEKGKDATAVRKDLVSLMKERKPVDPMEERDNRNKTAIQKVIQSLRSFKKDMNALKLIPDEIMEETDHLIEHLEEQIK